MTGLWHWAQARTAYPRTLAYLGGGVAVAVLVTIVEALR